MGTVRGVTATVRALLPVVAATLTGLGGMSAGHLSVGGRAARADGFAWAAPESCPSIAAVLERVGRHLSSPPDPDTLNVAVTVERDGHAFVARVDAPGIGIVRTRMITSRRCADLADAVGVIVARLAIEASVAAERTTAEAAADRENAADSETIEAMIEMDDARASGPASRALTAPGSVGPIEREEAPAGSTVAAVVPAEVSPRSQWGGGVRALAVSGVGAVPGIGVGADLGGYVRHRDLFGELALVHWTGGVADAMPTTSRSDVGLDAMAIRIGVVPEHTMLRAWFAGQVGTERVISGPYAAPGASMWAALGAGAGVSWPIADSAALVGTFEVLALVVSPTTTFVNGAELQRRSGGQARCALGLEVGWR